MTEIFHYCGMDTFSSILRTKKIWLTPVRAMKDGTEVDYLYEYIWPKVKANIISETTAKSTSQLFKMFDMVDKQTVLRSLQMPYCACFSDNGDLESQWLSYADNGKGVSIGFEADYFQLQIRLPHPHINIRNSLGIGSVIYDQAYQISNFTRITRKILSEEENNAECWITILYNLTCYSPFYKRPFYSSEQEKRIVYYYFKENHNVQFKSENLSGPYDHKNGKFMRFELSWYASEMHHAISKIIIGPKCQQSSSDTLHLLNEHNILLNKDQIRYCE